VTGPGLPIVVHVPGGAPASYQVAIGRGLLPRLGALIAREVPAHRYALIADSRVAELYGATALAALAAAGLRGELFSFPAGEWNKSRSSWAELTDRLVAAGFGRDCAIVALGGGVTGDLAGFVASTYMRGVPLIAVPTSLLAMLDSSVGGKTALDTPAGKNLVGTFHHPALVVIDPDLLATLPAPQRRAGLAEAVKTAAIRDAALFEWIEDRGPALAAGGPDELAQLIERCVRIKADVVAEDPTETGLRQVLNFGHTAGHALEALAGLALLHGEAVAAGMRIESHVGEALGVTEAGTTSRLEAVLDLCGIPDVVDASTTAESILEAAGSDKKGRGGRPRWVLLRRIGEVARAEGGDWSREIDPATTVAHLAAALRRAAEVRDSTP
jgi:3-dehydroquinate synthase